MNEAQLAILKRLLEWGLREHSYHSCNDSDVPNTPENIEILREIHEHDQQHRGHQESFELTPAAFSKGDLHVLDTSLYSYFLRNFDKLFRS